MLFFINLHSFLQRRILKLHFISYYCKNKDTGKTYLKNMRHSRRHCGIVVHGKISYSAYRVEEKCEIGLRSKSTNLPGPLLGG